VSYGQRLRTLPILFLDRHRNHNLQLQVNSFSMKWFGLAAVTLLLVACFFPWVTIDSRNIIVSGIEAKGTTFGKPGYSHLLLGIIFLICHLLPFIWAKRTNLIVASLNVAWAIRNYFVITTCRGGECPDKKLALYLVLIASVLMLISSLFPSVKMPGSQPEKIKV
jgi:hypothetical protein